MNDYEIERIAAAINVLRPDWPVRSLITLLGRPELAHRPRRDVTVALAWVACESGTSSPARVIEAGPWWKAAAVETPGHAMRFPPKGADECPAHLGEWAHACRICNGPPVVDETPEDRTRRRVEVSKDYAAHVDHLRRVKAGETT